MPKARSSSSSQSRVSQIHQLGAAGVGAIGDVQAAGEMPNEESVDGAEEEVARFGARPRAWGTWSSSQRIFRLLK